MLLEVPKPPHPSGASLLRENGDKVVVGSRPEILLRGILTELISKANLWDSDDRYI